MRECSSSGTCGPGVHAGLSRFPLLDGAAVHSDPSVSLAREVGEYCNWPSAVGGVAIPLGTAGAPCESPGPVRLGNGSSSNKGRGERTGWGRRVSLESLSVSTEKILKRLAAGGVLASGLGLTQTRGRLVGASSSLAWVE